MRRDSNRSGTSFRAIFLGIIFVVAVCFVVSYAELVIRYIQIGFLQFPPVVIGIFFFLVLGNGLLQKFLKRFQFSHQEMMTIYCMMLVASMISSRGLMEKLIPALIAVNYYANEANAWSEIFFPHIKPWLVPFDPGKGEMQKVSMGFYEKMEEWQSIPWDKWAVPLFVWGGLVIIVFFGFMCLASLLRRQWVDNEKLSFPFAQLPLEFVNGTNPDGLFRNRLTWIGFAIPAIIFTLNGIHGIIPAVPGVSLSTTLNRYFTEKPFNSIAYTPLYFSFAAVGFFYLLPTQLLFSLWIFFWLTRVQDVIAAIFSMRISTMPLYPTHSFIGYQIAGAYMVLVFYLLYVSLPYLKKVFGSVFRREKLDDSNELMPYSMAFWGLIISFVLTIAWCYMAGITLWFAAFEVLIYMFFVAIVMARSTAEGGLLMTETSFRPVDLYSMVLPKVTLGGSTLTVLSMFDAVFTRDQRGLILTGFLDSLKITDGVNMKRRSLLLILTTGILVALISAGVIHLWLPYNRGALNMYSYAYWGNPLWGFLDNAAAVERSGGQFVDWSMFGFFTLGIVITIGLVVMRTLFWWWPFHPLGYALSASWTMIVFWFPVFVAWGIKYPLMRYGGLKQYQKFRPFFLGMVFGEFGIAVLWTIVSWAAGIPAPSFPWP
ncbi:hypothetical protein GF312_11010 [Candidatus Poribacteria bacterium]|nr:hypothetical protein [Candidatus Poribacteria bacterium]